MKKIINLIMVIAALVVFLIPFGANANEVSVTCAQFPVVVNGRLVNNSMREYPFILYKSITYFPMTYDDCAFLGIENNWTKESGNIITKTSSSGKYNDFLSPALDETAKDGTASIVTTPVTVLGEAINNSLQEYPILNYKNVLYFPLTWDWSQKFGWKTTFGENRFLEVSTDGFNDSGYYYLYGRGGEEIQKNRIADAKEADVKDVLNYYSPNYGNSSKNNLALVFRLVEDIDKKRNYMYVSEELVNGFKQNGWYTTDEIALAVSEYAKEHTRSDIQRAGYRLPYFDVNGRSLSDHISSASYNYTSLYSADSRKCAVPNESVGAYTNVGWLSGIDYFNTFINNCVKKGDYVSALEFIEYNSGEEHMQNRDSRYIYVDEAEYDFRGSKYEEVGKSYLSRLKSSVTFRRSYLSKEGNTVYAAFDCVLPPRKTIESFDVSYDVLDASGRVINSVSENYYAYASSFKDEKIHRTVIMPLYNWIHPNIAAVSNVRISNVKFMDSDFLPGGQG